MLCGLRLIDKVKVFAYASTKNEAPFICPGCNGDLVLRKGNIKVHHFAHKPPYNCSIGKGETEIHRRCKEAIYLQLREQKNVCNVDVEANHGGVISDVFAVINGIKVAIEVQRSNLSVNEITHRTREYRKLGINVLWLALWNPNLSEEKYAPNAWEKWCHALYYGRVYYWIKDLDIVPVHFSEYELYVEGAEWYDPGGGYNSVGGYSRPSKRYRTPCAGKTVTLCKDFMPEQRTGWQSETIHIPECNIFIDSQTKWW